MGLEPLLKKLQGLWGNLKTQRIPLRKSEKKRKENRGGLGLNTPSAASSEVNAEPEDGERSAHTISWLTNARDIVYLSEQSCKLKGLKPRKSLAEDLERGFGKNLLGKEVDLCSSRINLYRRQRGTHRCEVEGRNRKGILETDGRTRLRPPH